MLKLERLDVSGFKSFVDPVHVLFAGGITGIVGPNGCGKSNLSDAITWVLGEQSAKSMRGDTMEDVIFNGSEKRKPLGMGEVTLSFLADASFAGGALGDDGRVTISRRVFRSGESQYRLNGKTVRLKEIKDLLMDTGLGIRAYSVIEQGKIGLILSGKPQERRKLIEEAAGITRYKARKKIAEVKLEEATANLLRLDDIVSEIERNLRSLKRQAGAARRFQERQAEWKTLHRAVLGGRWSRLASELSERRIALGESQTRETDLAANDSPPGGRARRTARAARPARRGALREVAPPGRARRDHRRPPAVPLRHPAHDRRDRRPRRRRTGGLRQAAARSSSPRPHGRRAHREPRPADRRARPGRGARPGGRRPPARGRVGRGGRRGAPRDGAPGAPLLPGRAHDVAQPDPSRADRVGEEQLPPAPSLRRARPALAGDHRGEPRTGHGQRPSRRDRGAPRRAPPRAHGGARDARRAPRPRGRRGRGAAHARARAHRRTERQRFLAELADGDREKGRALAEQLAALGISEPGTLGTRIHAMRGWERSLDLYLGDLIDAVVLSGRSAGARGRDPARRQRPRLGDAALAARCR